MYDPPGTVPRSSSQHHPRRPPAHRSVSLRHSPPPDRTASNRRIQRQSTALSSPNPASDRANPPSSLSPKLHNNKQSSGESSDAGRWFETTNNNAKQSNASFTDNDPPFFLRNSSSSETPPDAANYATSHPPMPYRPNLGHLGTDGSSTEDFRSVIDDLTIANKRLKQRLRKYEKQYDAHLQDEKLFEVRFHGLPDHKKKELEETLRKFASSLDDSGATPYPQLSSTFAPALDTHHTASSTSRFAESGYASMSASGQNSSAQSNQDRDRRKLSRSAYSRQQQNVHSYLHDIPVGLLPQSNIPMTDKSKKKLVVRRLEQIFAGKQSVPGNHQQPLQQEEVAQSAATADRERREATGQHNRLEGLRTARIRPDEARGDEDSLRQVESIGGLRPAVPVGDHDFAGPGMSPDQRPTRPLDLDLYRAQVPVENMNYIRHLGFTPPNMSHGRAQEAGHGWIYLNLLINMAQLHTLNVTPDFVKDALLDYSSHLEVSHDGRKVRWKGGRSVTLHSGDSSSEHHSVSPDNVAGSISPNKGPEVGHSGTSSDRQINPEQQARRLLRAKRESEQNKFEYKPLFFHKEDSEEEDDHYEVDFDSTSNSVFQPQPAANSSGFGSSAMQSSSSKPRRDDGPMIFYTKAKFCTDLSGDRLGATLTNPGAYKSITSHPLGMTSETKVPIVNLPDLSEPRGPLNSASLDVDSTSGSLSRLSSSGEEFGFSPEALKNDSGNDSPELMEFEASGIGGVQPEDNFSIHVRRSQTPAAPVSFDTRRRSSLYPKMIADALARQASPESEKSSPRASPQRVIREEILSASRRSLPNSVLPPASFLPFDSTSSGDVDSDLESEAPSSPESDTEEGATTALQILNVSPIGEDSSEEDSDESSEFSDDSDGSVDLLATARQLDPKTVRASEREYDAALADRLAEEIIAGSSAATAGGGSGFNSPADPERLPAPNGNGSIRNSKKSSSGSISSRTRNLKRRSGSDSLAVAANKKKSRKAK
ncbi:hypothetical protein ACN47E_003746 [Coniothyrium glycines]